MCWHKSGVADEDTLYILARLMGGAKKRKKKTYTKPKKQKHKHKKIKLRVLKFFKVVIVFAAKHHSLHSGRVDPTLLGTGTRQPTARTGALIAAPCRSQQGRSGSGVYIAALTYAGG